VLVTGAGTGSSGNVMRALRGMTPQPYIVGVNHDRFTLEKSLADRNYRCPPYTAREFVPVAIEIAARERIDVLMPTDDDAVKALSDHRRQFSISLLLPRRATIELCRDKHRLAVLLRRRGVPAPRSWEVKSLRSLEAIFRRLSRRGALWCRARHGTRSLAATPVGSLEQARAWITQWRDLRGVPVTEFALSEYLPGRHFVVQSLWRTGALLATRAVEVLSYFAAANNPSGVFSLPSLAKTLDAPEIVGIGVQAVQAIDSRPTGTFCVELKESAHGVPCVTEINAGRFPSGVTALLALGSCNMIAAFVRTVQGKVLDSAAYEPWAGDHYLVRDIDAVPGVFSMAEMLQRASLTSRTKRRAAL
jgi:carbamoyl-phosphate synthase large subunit